MPADLRVTFECDAFDPADVDVHEVSGVEELSQLFHFHVVLAARDRSAIDTDALVTGPGSLVFLRRDEEVRRIRGMVASVHDVTLTEAAEYTAWRIHFVPRAFRLTLSETVDIFMDLDVMELIEAKLKGNGLRVGDDVQFRLTKRYPKREFVVQYQETDLNFVSRQAEHYGITYFFEHGEKDKIVFTDANEVLEPIAGATLPWQIHHLHELGDDRVFSLEGETRAVPGRYTVRDYNYRTPGQDMAASATVLEGAAGEVVEYGTHFKNPEEGQRFARIRAEEVLATRWTFTGKSNAPALEVGRHFALEGHPRGDMELLLTRVEHYIRQPVFGTLVDRAVAYENSFTAIPREVTWRPPRRTVKPVVPGVVTGIVDATTRSQYADIDDDGRYRVKFMYDTAKRGEGQASRPVRMAQPHAGPGYGMHFPLRSGIEVILTCVNGDPDRPIIVGTVPNPATASPVTKSNLARNIIRTGGGNEMNFDDTEGSQRLKISIPHSDTTFQLGAPNSPEDGAMLATAEAWSAVAGQVATTATNASNLFSATAKFFAGTDITGYAGAAKNFTFDNVKGALDAFADVSKDVMNARKNWRDIKQKEYEARAKAYTGDTLRTGAELTRAKTERLERMARARAERDAAQTALLQAERQCANVHPTVCAGQASTQLGTCEPCCAEYNDALARYQAAEQNYTSTDAATNQKVTDATNAEKKAKDSLAENTAAQREAVLAAEAGLNTFNQDNDDSGRARRYGNVAADGLKNALKTIKAYKDGVKGAKTLLSALSKASGTIAATGAAGIVMTKFAVANAMGGVGRVTGAFGAIGKPYNIQVADTTAALVGVGNAIVGAARCAVVAENMAMVGSPAKAVVHSSGRAELNGNVKALITSTALIDAKSAARLKTHSGATTTMVAKGPMTLKTHASMGLTATATMKLKAGPLVSAKAANIKLEGTAKIDAKTATMKVDASAAIKMKAGSKVEAKVGGSTVRVTSGQVTMAKGGTMAKVTGSNAMMKHAGTKLTLSGSGAKLSGPKAKISGSGGVKITGAKIDLG